MSSLGIIIDGFYIDCLAPGNVINDRRHDEPPFFLSFSSLANPFSKRPFNNYVDKMRGEGSRNVSFCPRSGYKMNCSTVDIPLLSEALLGERI